MTDDTLTALVSTPMPYGKYKGVMLADLPGHYLNWMAKSGFPKGRLGQLLALMQEIDHNGLKHLLRPLRQVEWTKARRQRASLCVMRPGPLTA